MPESGIPDIYHLICEFGERDCNIRRILIIYLEHLLMPSLVMHKKGLTKKESIKSMNVKKNFLGEDNV